MQKKIYIAVDIGASTGRLIAGWMEEDKLYTKEIHRFVTEDIYLTDRRIRNVYRYYEEIIKGIKKYISESEWIKNSRIVSIGVDAFGSDYGILDKSGNLIMLPVSYRGLCFDNVYETVEKQIGSWEVYRYSGNQCMLSDTLHQLIRLKEEKPEIIEKAGGLLFVADIFHYFLCGNKGAEHSLASYSRLWNQEENKWESKIFDAFQFPMALQSPIVHSGEILGKMYREVAEDIGIAYQPDIVTPCSHDTACAALAVPDTAKDWIFISSGSWSLVGMETDNPVITKESHEFNASNSSMPFGINMLKKIVTGMWIMQMCQKQWKKYSFEEIVIEASKEKENIYYIDPDAPVFYRPHNMPLAICQDIKERYGVLIGESNVGKIARIYFESLALKYCYTIRKLMTISGREINKIYILGGGSRNRLLNQYTANALQLPVYTGVTEASAAGNILCQMYGEGELADRNEIKKVLKNTFPLTAFYPQEMSVWSNKYKVYVEEAHQESNVCSGRKIKST